MSNATIASGTTSTSSTTIAAATVGQIVDRYLAVWSEPNAGARREAVAALWAPDGVEYVENIQFRGHGELEPRIAEAYTEFVASGLFTIGSAEDVTANGGIVTFTIQLIANGGELKGQAAWEARVFLVIGDDGLIREDYHLTVKPLVV